MEVHPPRKENKQTNMKLPSLSDTRPLRYFFARELIALARELPGGKRELVEMESLSALAARAPCRRLRSTYHATPSKSPPLLVCDPEILYVSYLRKTIPVDPLPFDASSHQQN